MRYLSLVVLGTVLWADQASAAVFEGKKAAEIIDNGRIIHSHLRDEVSLFLRVMYKGDYFICSDGRLTEGVFLQCKSNFE